MSVSVGFSKGTQLKHKTKIRIDNGFLSFYSFTIKDETTGEDIKKKLLKVVVMEYEILEDGNDMTDEEILSRRQANKEKFSAKNKKEKENENEFSWQNNDDLPF